MITVFVALLLLLAQPDGFQTQFANALKALHDQNFTAAQAGLEAAGKLHPDDPHVWVALAETYRKLGNVELATDAAAKAAKLGANDPVTCRALALYYEANGQSLLAVQQLRALIRLQPTQGHYFDLIQLLLQHYNFNEAIEEAEAGLKKFPKSAQLTLAAGVAYYGQDLHEPAINKFLQTIALDPSIDQPYIFLARVIAQARAHLPVLTQKFAEYQARNPQSYLGYFIHAKALNAQFKDPQLAEELLRKSISIKGDYWESHFELAGSLEKRGALEESEREFRRAVELNPSEPNPHFRLCRVLSKLGRTDEAQAEAAVMQRVTDEYKADLTRRHATVEKLALH